MPLPLIESQIQELENKLASYPEMNIQKDLFAIIQAMAAQINLLKFEINQLKNRRY